MIDEFTFKRFAEAQDVARLNGLSLVEVLDRAELLLSTRRRHDLSVKALEDLVRRLDRQAPHKLMSFYYGRTDGTSAEMFEAMKMWVDAVCRNLANNTLGEL